MALKRRSSMNLLTKNASFRTEDRDRGRLTVRSEITGFEAPNRKGLKDDTDVVQTGGNGEGNVTD